MNEPAVTLLNYLRNGNTLPSGARLLIAVSGGADSMALLHLYTRVRDALRLTITAATFDHGLRGGAGHADALHVKETASKWGVPCVVGQAADEHSQSSIEAWARQARYGFLAATAREFSADFVATAHHADDQAETVLANIVRGAGGHGLGGMRPVSPLTGAPEITLIRPLLGVTHTELVAYCRAEGIVWHEDTTNTDTRHRRNWIRHKVIPLLREANPNVTSALWRLAASSAEQDDFLRGVVDSLFAEHATIAVSRVWIPRQVFQSWHPAVQKRALIRALAQIAKKAEPDFEGINAATALTASPEGGIGELGADVLVTVDSGWLSVAHRDAPWTPPYEGYWLDDSGNNDVRSLTASGKQDKPAIITVMAPADANFNVRRRRDGDRIYPPSLHGKSQKLKDWLINKKIPRQLRDHLPVIEGEGRIVGIWDGSVWQIFTPPFDAATIEINLTWDARIL